MKHFSNRFGNAHAAVRWILVTGVLLAAPKTPQAVEKKVSFQRDIAPILQSQCLTCHRETKAKGDYRLDSFEYLLRAGSSGEAAIVRGKPEESFLFELIVTADEDDRMPQKGDPLSENQIDLIRNWILHGAKFDGNDPVAIWIPERGPEDYPPAPKRYPVPLEVTALAFHPDGETLATSGYGEALLWQASKESPPKRIGKLPRQIHDLEFSSDCAVLAVAGGAPAEWGEATLVHLESGKVSRIKTMAEVQFAVAISDDGALLASGGADNTIHLFDLHSDSTTATSRREIRQHADWVMDLSFSPDGKWIASAGRDRSARVYSVETGELLATCHDLEAPIHAVAFSRDGSGVLCAGKSKDLHHWNREDGKTLKKVAGVAAETFGLLATADHYFSCGSDNLVRQYAVKDHKLVHSFAGHQDWVYSIACDPEGTLLASGSHDGEVRIWKLEDGSLLRSFLARP